MRPSVPHPVRGRVPAVAYARATIARSLIQARRAAGLSQQDLARLAGVRQETLSRIETGKHTVAIRTMDRIERALLKTGRRRKTA